MDEVDIPDTHVVLLEHSWVGEVAGGAGDPVEEDTLAPHTVHSIAVTAWHTGGCTGPAAACMRSTAGTGHTVLGLPWVDHDHLVHVVVLAWGLVHRTVGLVHLLHTLQTPRHIQALVLVLPEVGQKKLLMKRNKITN